jgi:hypothetical protein
MSPAPGPRFGLVAIGGADFIKDIDELNQAQVDLLEAHAVRVDRGTLLAKPISSGSVPGIPDRFYFATDQTPQQLWYDTGAGWILVGTGGGGAFSTGDLKAAYYASPAAGWALCNGASNSTTSPTYAALFAVIGYTAGGSAGTFLLPNYTDRVIVGAGGSFALGATGGEQTHELTQAELASHSHGVTPQSGGETPAGNPLVYVNGLASHSGLVSGGGDLSNYFPRKKSLLTLLGQSTDTRYNCNY